MSEKVKFQWKIVDEPDGLEALMDALDMHGSTFATVIRDGDALALYVTDTGYHILHTEYDIVLDKLPEGAKKGDMAVATKVEVEL